MAEDGVTTSGYGTEYACQIRAFGYSPVGDEVIPSNAKNTSLACHVMLTVRRSLMQYLESVCCRVEIRLLSIDAE